MISVLTHFRVFNDAHQLERPVVVSRRMEKKVITVLSLLVPRITGEIHGKCETIHLSDLVYNGIPHFASVMSQPAH
jgi:hypothetical protein